MTTQPTVSDAHVNAPLTNISVAFLSNLDDFIATQVFPVVSVQKQSDVYFEFPRGQWFRTEAAIRGVSQESAGGGFDLTTSSYRADVRALHKDLDDMLLANMDAPLDLDTAAVEYVTRGLMLRREKDFVDNFFTTSVWTGSSTGGDITPGTLWDVGGSTPIVDIRTEITSIKRKTGLRPNAFTMSGEVWDVLQDNADFTSRIATTRDQIVTTQLLANVLGVEKVLIADSVENTADEGATDSFSFVAGKNALLTYSPATPSLMTPSAGYHFSWDGYLAQQGMRMMRFREEKLRSARVEGELAYDQHVVAADLGAFFSAVIS